MKEQEKKIEYEEDGKTLWREYHVNEKGLWQGSYKWWWNNNLLGVQCVYVNGNIHGIYKKWHPEGQAHWIDQYKKGDEHGIKIIFYY